MLAYASADIQGSHETAWAWAGGGVLQRTMDHTIPATDDATSAYDHAMGEEPEWNGWDCVMDILSQLEQKQHRSMQQQDPSHPQPQALQQQQPPPRPQYAAPHMLPQYAEPHQQAPSAPYFHSPPAPVLYMTPAPGNAGPFNVPAPAGTRSRISIKDII
jgi:hypothetical protein